MQVRTTSSLPFLAVVGANGKVAMEGVAGRVCVTSSVGLLKDSSFGGCASYYEGSKLILLYNSGQKVGLPCASLKEGGLLMRRRTLPLLATTISLALLLVVGGVAASKQRHEQSTSSSS